MKASRVLYAAAAWLFLAGVVTQVFFAGMAAVAHQWSWDNHAGLGHVLAAPLLLMLVTAYTGRLPGRMKRLTWLLFGVYVLQADVLIFLRDSAPVMSAFHPVMALFNFALGAYLAWRSTTLGRAGADAPVERLQPESASAD
jgi:hypothetical protein